MRHSKIQKQVLSLFRQFLRESRSKPGFTDHIRAEFRKHAALPRTDGLRIEYLLRRGERQLKELKKVECQAFGYFVKEEANKR
ncbi:predicted protein [Nematostella vectensis]|uniref:Complex 1 LYR protein domain-containing protein n=1 Tax=Nematostella vectensis TaxID=45351 RepID=A7RJ53_NEMVE|nr:predicted protein [Nematostella vectensis]|eukprot:XP_001640580.1 predicted protein [Nematostella vectensis]